jgi:Replication-relaxation
MIGGYEMSGRRSGRVASAEATDEVRGRKGSYKAPDRLTSGLAGEDGPAGRGRRVSRRQLARIERDLSERERAVLTSVDQFRFLTTGQLQTLHFGDHATETAGARIGRRVLARLAELRVIEHLERRIGGIRAGSASYVWRVGATGDRLLRQASGEGRRARRKEPSPRYLDHALAIADCYIALVLAARRGEVELQAVETEPGCWRRFLGGSGAPETLKPDLYLVTAAGEFEDHWFVEVDRSTESLNTLLRKCAQYERYGRTGREQAAAGVFPRVLWVVMDKSRATKLGDALRGSRRLDPDLYRITTTDAFARAVIGGSV